MTTVLECNRRSDPLSLTPWKAPLKDLRLLVVETRRQRLRDAINLWFEGNQAAFARAVGRTPPQINDMLKGTKPFGERIARSFEEVLSGPPYHMPAGWFDMADPPQSLTKIKDLPALSPNRSFSERADSPSGLPSGEVQRNLLALPPHVARWLETGEVIAVPVYGGDVVEIEDSAEVVGALVTDQEALRRRMPRMSAVKNIYGKVASSDAMESTFRRGDILMIDGGINEIATEGIYLFTLYGELFCRRLHRKPGTGTLLMIADNKRYPDHELSREDMRHLHVLGRAEGTYQYTPF